MGWCLAGLALVVACCALAVGLGGPGGPPESPNQLAADGWAKVNKLQFNEAAKSFDRAITEQPERQARLGLAVSLLNVQPLTQGNVDRSAEILQSLRTENGDDEVGIEATYDLARVEQLHRFKPDAKRALELYDELADSHPEHRLGQMAIVKAGMLRLFELPTDAERLALFDRLAARGKSFTDTDARRDLHLMLAAVAQFLHLSDPRALEQLIEADRVGLAKQKTAGDVWVRIAVLAGKLDQPALAAKYYRKFADTFPRDQRTHLVRERLAEFTAGDPNAAPNAEGEGHAHAEDGKGVAPADPNAAEGRP